MILQGYPYDTLKKYEPFLWLNPEFNPSCDPVEIDDLRKIEDAAHRLDRFRSYILKAFPETASQHGKIESPIVPLNHIKRYFEGQGVTVPGSLLIKRDDALPISGSIKARGGIYEVLKLAETIALREGLITLDSDYSALLNPEVTAVLSQWHVLVGSTGNLGLSIGIMSAKLGFNVQVHMSQDAKAWKMDLLKEKGAQVIAHPGDYSLAVESARTTATEQANSYFVDDENSEDLFWGYAVGGIRVKESLLEQGIEIDETRPLYVYLPCGVGGGPGGVALGLKAVFGEHVHIYFVEPTHAPCMLLGMASGLHEDITIEDIGLELKTHADGLAVGRPSGFVGRKLLPYLEGIATVEDKVLYDYLRAMVDYEAMWLEPSALAGFAGLVELMTTQSINASEPVHLIWSTGGGMVPEHIRESYYQTHL